jgi:type III restriction enzyme
VDLTLKHTKDMRQASLIFHLARRLLFTKYRDPNGEPRLGLFNDLRRITRQWLDNYLVCVGGTYPAQLLYQELADMAGERIHAAIVERHVGEHPVVALLDPFNPEGSSRHVQFTTSRESRWQTDAQRCHINWVVLDSSWEGEFCRAVEQHPQVRAYVKNHSLGFEVPYRMGSEARRYRPDFIVLVDDGHGSDDLLHLIVEIKGRRGEDAKIKATTLRTFWVPAINRDGRFGRWAAAEFTDPYGMEADLAAVVEAELQRALKNGQEGGGTSAEP